MSAVQALQRAREATRGAQAPTVSGSPRYHVAIGDPQAPGERFFEILERGALLNAEGWLRADVHLVSIGDHFDYGPYETRVEAGRAGVLILSWLAAHSVAQVTLIAGNHDLGRIADLISFDDATFAQAAAEAHQLYQQRPFQAEAEQEFLARFPALPSVEVAARDLCTFAVEQRELVTRLVQQRRFRFAKEVCDLLLCHAGATRWDLQRAGLEARDHATATLAAAALNRVFDDAVAHWDPRVAFEVPGFFEAGSASNGEAGGFLFHRPALPSNVDGKDRKRRFDPRELPLGLVQVVGHIRDAKCRTLLGAWVRDEPAAEGELRHLRSDGHDVSYARGPAVADHSNTQIRSEAQMLFIDGGMNHADPKDYQLLNIATRGPWFPIGAVTN